MEQAYEPHHLQAYTSQVIKEFEIIGKLPYEKKRPKHEPTDSYFHLARQLAKCMMRSDKLNWHDHGGYTKMTAPSSNIIVTDEDESKEIIVHETLLESWLPLWVSRPK